MKNARAKRKCRKKKRYGSKTQAVATKIRLEKAKGIIVRSYKCQFCKSWHLTKLWERV